MIEMARTLRILGDHTRLRILRLLMKESLNVGELTRILGLAQPTVSKHLRELKKTGLVEDNRNSSYSYYGLSDHGSDWWNLFAPKISEAEDGERDLVRLREILKQREERAEAPDRFVVPGRSWTAWSRSLQYLLPSLRVADFGCGDGTFTVEVARWAKQVYAIDCNARFLRLARRRAAGFKNIRFLRESVQNLSLRARSVDLVLISQSLHYVEEPLQALREAHRLLAEGGRVLILDLLPHREEWVRSQLDHQWLGFEPSQVERWLRQSGFRRLNLDTSFRHAPEPFRNLIATGLK